MARTANEVVNVGPRVTDADGRLIVVAADGAPIGTGANPSTATLTNVASSASSVTLLSANTSAKLRSIFNDSTTVLYVKYGATASTSSYTVQIPAGGYYEFPQPLYNGRVDGIWASANGNARVTEA